MKRPLRVLIVDDIAETRQSVRRLIEFEEDLLVVGEASTGEEALECARRLRPDCLLMDVNMPGMDGIRATELARVELPGSVVVLMSVQAELEYQRRAFAAGAGAYLVKPFSGAELVESIRSAYLVQQANSSPHTPPEGTIRSPRVLKRARRAPSRAESPMSKGCIGV